MPAGASRGSGGGSSTAGATSSSGGAISLGSGGATSSSGGSGIALAGADAGGACQQAEVVFQPKYPTVFVLVDRSGSMFDMQTANGMQFNSWTQLRAAALPVIQALQTQVRFAFGAFTGQNGGVCPDFPTVPADLNNYQAIATLYNSLDRPTNTADKETPTGLVLPKVGDLLWADASPGSRYVLFITDGEPDYCDDGNPLCPPDSVVYRLQQLFQGKDTLGGTHDSIQTFVLGLKSSLSTVSQDSLQAWANAGQGQPVALWGQAATDPNAMYDQCNSVTGWAMDFAATGKPKTRGQTIGDYAATGGTAKVYQPDAGDQTALADQIAQLINNVKTCTFDLQGKIKVDLPNAGKGQVLVDGNPITYDASGTNGWHMVTDTQLELSGSACDNWRATGMKIDFNFPCDIIIVVK